MRQLQAELATERSKNNLLQSQKECLNKDMKRLVDAFESVRSHRDRLLKIRHEQDKPTQDKTRFACMY